MSWGGSSENKNNFQNKSLQDRVTKLEDILNEHM